MIKYKINKLSIKYHSQTAIRVRTVIFLFDKFKFQIYK